MNNVTQFVIVTEFGAIPLSPKSSAILDLICDEWRAQIHNKRYRNKQIQNARKFVAALQGAATNINRTRHQFGKPLLESI